MTTTYGAMVFTYAFLLTILLATASSVPSPTDEPVLDPPTPQPVVELPPAPSEETVIPPSPTLLEADVIELREQLEDVGGCHASVCFAFDGSSAMPEAEFLAQKNFVLDLVSVIAVDTRVGLSAVQYAKRDTLVHPFGYEAAPFVLAVNGSKQIGGLSRTRGGVRRCGNQLSRRSIRGNPAKLVLLGDGVTSVGRDAVHLANRFRRRGGALSVVAAGDVNRKEVLALAGNNETRVFEVDSFLDVLKIQEIVEKLVVDICDLGGKGFFGLRGCGRECRRKRRQRRRERRQRRRERRRIARQNRRIRRKRRQERRMRRRANKLRLNSSKKQIPKKKNK